VFELGSKLSRIKWLAISFVLLVLVSVAFELSLTKKYYSKEDVDRFQTILQEKELKLQESMAEIEDLALEYSPDSLFFINESEFLTHLDKQSFFIYIYENDKLRFWTSNEVPVPDRLSEIRLSPFLKFSDSYYVTESAGNDSLFFLGLILVKKEMPYENRFLASHYQKDFDMSPEIGISIHTMNGFPVFNYEGDYLFNLNPDGVIKPNKKQRLISVGLYLLCFIVFLVLLSKGISNATKKHCNIFFFLSILVLFAFYILINYYSWPDIIFQLELFSPEKFARSAFLPSLGDLLLIVTILFFINYNFYINYRFKVEMLKSNNVLRYLLMFFMILVAFVFYLINALIFKSIIVDSTISFETYKVLDLSAYTFIGFLILAFLFISYSLLVDKMLNVLHSIDAKTDAKAFTVFLILMIFLVLFLPGQSSFSIESTIFYSLSTVLFYYFRFINKTHYRFSSFVVFVLLFSIFTVFEVVKYTHKKSISEMKMMAVNLSAEHDPVAELFFSDIDKQLKNDSIIYSILDNPVFDYDELYSFIQRKYFNGFWDKYDLQITLCDPDDSVYVSPPEDAWYHCYDFFYETILREGYQVPGSDFYYLDNLNGRISYFASLEYNTDRMNEVTLFIELDSRLISEGLGFPELLLEDNFSYGESDYSYAKYNEGKLITSSGEFAYNTTIDAYMSDNEGFDDFQLEGYDHVLYKLDKDNAIIVSYPSVFYIDVLISFSYIFGFYFLILVILLSSSKLSPFTINFNWNFQTKVQLALTGLLFFTVLFIGIGIVYFSIKQNQSRHYEILQEKMQSVYVELMHKLEFETDLHNWSTDSYYNLNALLQKFSNVFYSDINLYDAEGKLLASSRPQIFEKGLIDNRMNTEVYYEMSMKKRSEYIHNERIGKLRYLSAYVPFVNAENELLAYLNLPYFTRQDELTREVTNLVVAIINIIVLLSLLSLTFAVFLSNTITSPLRLIQQKMSQLGLNKQNEKIEYSGKDEIGRLVDEYNTMVGQLHDSAEILAKSERETAWREMAKQIAHEIKNPLTPMKLGIQHLQRAAGNKDEDLEKSIDKISRTLIDQIDTLSSIATEFSNFAKMPVAKNVRLDLVQKLKNTIGLFDDKKGNIELNLNKLEELWVFADKEQLSRVIINLIKNGMQSVPDSKKAKINIELSKKDERALITIRDNGKGIPEDIRDKLFQPNFTTKTSGMGMGLAIVKNIIEAVGGEISYETELNKGTTFFVELPVID